MKRSEQTLTSNKGLLIVVALSLLVWSVMLLWSLWQSTQTSWITLTHQSLVFGTTVDVTLQVESQHRKQAQTVLAQLDETFQQLHQDWHAWDDNGGVLQRLNQRIRLGQSTPVERSVLDFFVKTQHLSAQSLGYFEPALGALFALWGFHAQTIQQPPSENDIQAILSQNPTIANLRWNRETQHIWSTNPAVQLDVGGNAKGYFLDLAIQTLQKANIRHALVSIGGDMKALGRKRTSDGHLVSWHIAIENPQPDQRPLYALDIESGEALFTSGTYRRFFDYQGKRYAHLIHPKTGHSIDEVVSVTVIHDDAMTADIAATAIAVAGLVSWQAVAQSLDVTQVLLVDHQGRVHMTPDMSNRLIHLHQSVP